MVEDAARKRRVPTWCIPDGDIDDARVAEEYPEDVEKEPPMKSGRMSDGTGSSAAAVANEIITLATDFNQRKRKDKGGKGRGNNGGARGGGGKSSSRGTQNFQPQAGSQAILTELVIILAKLCLSNAQMVRQIIGSIWRVTLMAAKSPPVVKGLQVLDKYHWKVRKLKEEDNQQALQEVGPPHPHMWVAFVSALLDMEEEIGVPLHAELERYWSEILLELSHLEVCKHVRHFSIRTTAQENKMKIIFKLTEPKNNCTGQEYGIDYLMLQILEKIGAEVKHGPPPASVLEREASKLLNRFQS